MRAAMLVPLIRVVPPPRAVERMPSELMKDTRRLGFFAQGGDRHAHAGQQIMRPSVVK
jgi:hypothetical protein